MRSDIGWKHLEQTTRRCLLVVLLQSLHEVPAALDVPPLDVRVEAGAQGELEGLAGDRLRRSVHDEVVSGETLVEVTLLQVESEEEFGIRWCQEVYMNSSWT